MEWLRKWLRLTSYSYTVAALLILFAGLLLEEGNAQRMISVEAFLLVFAFAACYAVGHLFYCEAKLSRTLRIGIHYLISVLAVFFFLYLPNNNGASASGKLLMLLLIAVLYWVPMGVCLLIGAGRKTAPTEGTGYRNVYKK